MLCKSFSKNNLSTHFSFISILLVTYASIASNLVYAQVIPSIVKNNNCVTCHSSNKNLMGPSWQDISKKYKNDANAKDTINFSISNGTSGKWSAVPMPANPQLKKDEVDAISKWILQQ